MQDYINKTIVEYTFVIIKSPNEIQQCVGTFLILMDDQIRDKYTPMHKLLREDIQFAYVIQVGDHSSVEDFVEEFQLLSTEI